MSGENSQTTNTTSATNESQRTVPFITLRNRTDSNEATKYFGDDRSIRSAGHCVLTRTPLKALEPIADSVSFYIPDEIVQLGKVVDRPVKSIWSDLEASAGRPVLYTHGYYMDFERSCKRASMLQDSLGLAGRLLLFSWPSDGAILNYTLDESDLYWSVAPLVETLTEMVANFGAGNFDVTAHSLGTRGVFLALVHLANKESGDKPLINELVFLAPDIDIGIFKQYLSQIRPLAKSVTIYVSGNDTPLALSRQVHGHPRLGESGPHLNGLAGVEIIDLSEIPVSYPSGHVYHLYNNVVATDLAQLLNQDKPASQRSNLKKSGTGRWSLETQANHEGS